MTRRMRLGWPFCVWLPLALSACSLHAAAAPSPITQVALTVGAVFTQIAAGGPSTPTPLLSSPSPEAPGETPSEIPTLGGLPSPVAAATASTCYQLQFGSDVTLPDDTPVQPGATLVKTWGLLNSGSCPWRTDTQIVFVSGDQMDGPSSDPIGQTVAVGEEAQISVTLTAPLDPGTYQGYWMLQSPDGTRFGYGPGADQAFWVEIVVLGTPAATVTAMETLTATPGPSPSATLSSTPTLQPSAAPTGTSTVVPSVTSAPTATSTVASNPTSTLAPSSTPAPTPTSLAIVGETCAQSNPRG
ncbi:MAG: NBR1-Ig-like domain-containing protein [Anaerolineales bacterium]